MGLKTTLFAIILLIVFYWRKYMMMRINGKKPKCPMAKKTTQPFKKSMKILKSYTRQHITEDKNPK